MNSVVWPGKFFGTLAFEPIVQKLGFKKTVLLCAVIQCIAIIIEMTAKEWIQFSIGRIVAYFAVGVVEIAVPTYQAEVAPSHIRGLLAGSIMAVATTGNIWGAGMSRALANETSPKGWLIPVGVQLIPAVGLLVMAPFTVESPRWLLLKGDKERAMTNMLKLRSSEDAAQGVVHAEIEALDEAISVDRSETLGSWVEVFRGNYLRRLLIACGLFFFQQTTGSQYLLSYGPTFYKTIGLGAMSFTYNIAILCTALAGAIIALATTDIVGRRNLLTFGTLLTVCFGFVATGLATRPTITQSTADAIIASYCLGLFGIKISLSTHCYLIGSEVGGVRMRKKILALGGALDVLAAFAVTFSYPYIANSNPGAGLGPKTGYIYTGLAVLAFFFVVFCVPELKGRSLEEIDELFEAKLWAWQFSSYKTTGVGARITQLDAGIDAKIGESKAKETYVEHA